MTAKKKRHQRHPQSRPKTKARSKPRPSQRPALVLCDPTGMLPHQQPAISVSRQIGQGIALLGDLGLVEMTFTPQEEAVMNKAVDEALVRMKPGKKGPPIPFLPHIEYTRWFNAAFGRGAWNAVPIDLPKLTNKTVSRDYVLFVHGKPVAFATGDQDYFETNERQTYGDALEATMSSALRRFAKHLGMGLELWDKDWIDAFIRKYQGRVQYQPPPQGEHGSRQRERTTESQPPATARTGQEHEPISIKQRQRLAIISKQAGRQPLEVKAYLKAHFGIDSSQQLLRKDYERVCSDVEKPGRLPAPPRDPDEIITDRDLNWGLRS